MVGWTLKQLSTSDRIEPILVVKDQITRRNSPLLSRSAVASPPVVILLHSLPSEGYFHRSVTKGLEGDLTDRLLSTLSLVQCISSSSSCSPPPLFHNTSRSPFSSIHDLWSRRWKHPTMGEQMNLPSALHCACDQQLDCPVHLVRLCSISMQPA